MKWYDESSLHIDLKKRVRGRLKKKTTGGYTYDFLENVL